MARPVSTTPTASQGSRSTQKCAPGRRVTRRAASMKNARAGSEKAPSAGTEAQSAANAARRRRSEGAIAANAARSRSSHRTHFSSDCSFASLSAAESRTTTAKVARAGQPNRDASAAPSTANMCPRERVATRREGPNPRRARGDTSQSSFFRSSRSLFFSSRHSSPSATRISTHPRSMTHRHGVVEREREPLARSSLESARRGRSARTSPASATRSRNRARSVASRSEDPLPAVSSSNSRTFASSAASLRFAFAAAAFSFSARSRLANSPAYIAAYVLSSPSARFVKSRAFRNDERGSAAFLAAFSSAFFLAASRASASAALRASRAFAVAIAAPCSGRYASTHWTERERESARSSPKKKAREGEGPSLDTPEFVTEVPSSSTPPSEIEPIWFTMAIFAERSASSRSRSASRTAPASSRQRRTSRRSLVSPLCVSVEETCACMSSRVVDVCARRMSSGSTDSRGARLGGTLEAFPGTRVRGVATELALSDVSCKINARRFRGSIVARPSRVASPGSLDRGCPRSEAHRERVRGRLCAAAEALLGVSGTSREAFF